MSISRNRPETLRLRGIAPSLTVNDLEASLRWYCDVVGFYRKQVWEEDGRLLGAELVAGSQALMLTQDDWGKGRDRVKGAGLRLYLETTQSVDDVAERVREQGGVLASEPRDQPWGARTFDLVDPDGFLLTISSSYS
ncbi:MAG TPA: VOC family protein [Longimicrobiales bacterium]|nr:VOC family protein [Longimicrobiales bacterium]